MSSLSSFFDGPIWRKCTLNYRLKIKRLLVGFGLATSFGFAVPSGAVLAQSCEASACPAVKVYGDSQDAHCRAWATEAVGQQLENEQRSCGNTGEDWHFDIKLHFRICGGLSQLDREQYSKARADVLGKCRSAPKKAAGKTDAEPKKAEAGKVPEWDEYCRKSYMIDALKVARTAKEWKCTGVDPQLHLSKQRHYDFCVRQAPKGAGDYPLHDQIGDRQEKIKRCQQDAAVKKPIDRKVMMRRRACSKFADIFLNAKLENNRLKCAYAGDDRNTKWKNQNRGCKSITLSDRLRQINDRQSAMSDCRAKVFPKGQLEADDPDVKPEATSDNGRGGPSNKVRQACDDYAKDAVAHEAANKQLSCGFSGSLWTLTEATHFKACISSRADYAFKSNMARDAKLRRCTAARLCKDPTRAKTLFCQDLTGIVPPNANN